MSEFNIKDIANQALPYLIFKDSEGKAVEGSKLSVATFYPPDMSKASGATIEINWTNQDPISLTPNTVDTAEFTNGSDETQSQTFHRSYTDTQTFTWTLSEKFQLGVSSTTKAGVNLDVFSLGEEFTVSFSFEIGSTQSWTNTETKTFSVDFPLKVPPHTIVKAKWILQQLKNITLPFTAVYELSGTVSLTILAVTGEYTWTGSTGQLITAAVKGGAKNWTVNGDVAHLSFSGKLVADQGVVTQVVVTQKDLEGNSK